jgi:hypothetical protein
LGAETVRPILIAMLDSADPKSKTRAAEVSTLRTSRNPALRDALMTVATGSQDPSRPVALQALSQWSADPAITALMKKLVENPQEWQAHPNAVAYLLRILPEDQKNATLAHAARAWNGNNNIATLLDRGALNEIRTVVSETNDRIQAGIIQNLCSTAVASAKPELRKFAAEMSVLALQKPSADTHALIGIASGVRTLGADAAPVLPLLKALKPEELKDAAKPVAEAIAEIEAKMAAAAGGKK